MISYRKILDIYSSQIIIVVHDLVLWLLRDYGKMIHSENRTIVFHLSLSVSGRWGSIVLIEHDVRVTVGIVFSINGL